jgi:DNA-binding CsgD family transcriptional regulator
MERQPICAILASHLLVSSYLRDCLSKLNVDSAPTILSAHNPKLSCGSLEPGTIVLVDLYDLPYPVSSYLKTFQGASFLGMGDLRSNVDTAALLMAGFAGFVLYADVPSSLALAIRTVVRGKIWTSPEVMRTYITLTSRRIKIAGNGCEMLTRRESDILELLQKRYSNREMSEFFGIAESTIKFHVSNIFSKLNVSRRGDLSRFARASRTKAEIA